MWILLLILLLILLCIVLNKTQEHFNTTESPCNCIKKQSHITKGREQRMYDTLTYTTP